MTTTKKVKTIRRFGCDCTDITEEMNFNIIGKDRKGSNRTIPNNCPISRTVKRSFGLAVDCYVHNEVVYTITEPPINYDPNKTRQSKDFIPGKGIRGVLSQADKEKMKSFDESNYGFFPLGPVRILPPSPTKRLGGRAGSKPGSNTRTGKTMNVLKASPTRARAGSGEYK